MQAPFFINQTGTTRVTVGGIRLLLEFSPTEVRVKVRNKTVLIMGENLTIERFDANEIVIIGKIHSTQTE
ncbi:MAG: YabP/YqfC family sporulation protein [Firmicutes bacterium]|nr:YabP/YqfC family sporulation protein [Bacillota bacterium]